jgi:hypothetical protein
MNEFETAVSTVIRDTKRLASLLALEKERRGLPADTLVFVGMHNLAGQRWCEQQAVFKSRAEELTYFGAYLLDRILYARRLGLITQLPNDDKAILDSGNEITWGNVEHLFQEEVRQAKDRAERLPALRVTWFCEDVTDADGKRTRLINPDLPPEEQRRWREHAVAEGVQVIDPEDDPKRRGKMYQRTRAEKYPRVRWHFPWGRYVVVGIADGLTNDFVYEYKTTRNSVFRDTKAVALAQADLYGYFFRRPKKRVQILVVEKNATRTYEEAVDAAQAEDTLTSFARVDQGEPARPPVAWKCRRCEFRTTCPISQAE